jgi:uncharacterized protein DUF6162
VNAPWRRLGFPAAQTTPIRRVDVTPPSQSDEGFWVLMAAGVVVLGVIYTIAFQIYGTGSGAPAAQRVLPFQVLFRDLPGAEQRVFREIQEGLIEAMAARAATGAWPTPEELAARGIPPFARDARDSSNLRWELRRDGLVVNYTGTSDGAAEQPSFLLLIQEPDPVSGEKLSPRPIVDEEHQVLPDASQTLLHVTIWKKTGPPSPGKVVLESPATAGWTQIRVADPFEALEKKP